MGLGKGTGSGRPKKEKPKRTSGTGYKKGEIGYNNLKYKVKTPYKDTYEIDVKKIKELIDLYIKDNKTKKETITDKQGNTTETETEGVLSRAGLRLKLDISKTTYCDWLQGYVNSEDKTDEAVNCNYALADAMRAGDDEIARYLSECNAKYGDTKRIRLLESMGEIGQPTTNSNVNLNISLGKLSKYSK